MSYLKKYFYKYGRLFATAVSCLTVEAVCDLLQPTIMSRVIDIGVAAGDMKYVLRMGGLMFLVTLLGALAAISRNILASKVSLRFGRDLRSDLFQKIQSFSFDDIDRFETASLVTRLTNDVTQVQNFVNGLMRIFVKAPLLCVGSLVMATLLNPRMALVLLVVVPVIGLLIFLNAKKVYPFFIKVQKMIDRMNSVMREYLSGVRVVKAFNRSAYETGRFEKTSADLSTVSIAAMRVMAAFAPGITLIVNLGIIAVLWLGGYRVDDGSMRVGQVIAFINYMTQVLYSIMLISHIFMVFVRARASAERIGEVMTQENGLPVSGFPEEPTGREGSVVFDQVYFSYTGTSGEPVLKGISFSCTPGETIGIIGSTGSGKSSLVNLIPRFYDVLSGSVRISGIDVRDMEPAKLRQRIAIVPQKATLFTGTILENILWGRENATVHEVEIAAEVAQAHGFISSFPEGYHTRLGQGGVNLSGGQKQRISIARALVRKPDILILDDCTSAVDMITEARIREGLKQYSEGMTCFIIAQRITSVMQADRIVVLDNGEAVGIGTHAELMQSCGVYRDIFRSQIGKEGV